MTPNTGDIKEAPKTETEDLKEEQEEKYKWDIVWINVIGITYLHIAAIYGLYLGLRYGSLYTHLFGVYMAITSSFGITAGSHRYWCHKSYKAKLPLRILLCYFNSCNFQNPIYIWVRDHRVHHKFSDTDADPHNAARGFFFSHVGWLMVKKHKDVKEKGKTVWMKDMEEDKIVMFQKKFYFVLMPLCCFIIPTLIPWYFWNEDIILSFHYNLFRYCYALNITWALNSVTHLWGYRPYDKNMYAVNNNILGPLAIGEGWHNYHHVFPWDYKTSEFMSYWGNLSTGFIDLMAKIGWAYDLKTVREEMIEKRARRTGDGTYFGKMSPYEPKYYDYYLWGWDDNDLDQEMRTLTERLNVPKEE